MPSLTAWVENFETVRPPSGSCGCVVFDVLPTVLGYHPPAPCFSMRAEITNCQKGEPESDWYVCIHKAGISVHDLCRNQPGVSETALCPVHTGWFLVTSATQWRARGRV